jgi:nicotinamidase-related amidase
LAENAPWLVAIDLQRIFADPASPWSSPRYEDAAVGVARLRPAFGENTVLTRYVAPAQPQGAWAEYFELWPFALVPPDDSLYELDPRFAHEPRIETREAFGKWDDRLARAIGGSTRIVLAGVATDCCVISTALAAADAGIQVRVVADACAGSTVADHERALAIMALYAPLIEITTVAEVLAE